MQKIRKVLITGADGFIGRNLVDHLWDKYDLVCIARGHSYKPRGVKIVYGDVTDEDTIRQAVKGVDAVVHLAAILNPLEKDIGKVNIGSTRLLVGAARSLGVKKFIFISSENVLYDFDDAYSKSKKVGERMVKTFPNHLILRPTLVYGKYDRRYVGRIADVIQSRKVVPIPGSGNKLFQPVYVDDVVKCIENGLKYDVQGEYIVAGPSKISYNDFVSCIIKEIDVKTKVVHVPLGALKFVDYMNKKFLRIPKIRLFQVKSLEIDRVYDIRKSVKALKYKPTPVNVGIRKTVGYLKDL